MLPFRREPPVTRECGESAGRQTQHERGSLVAKHPIGNDSRRQRDETGHRGYDRTAGAAGIAGIKSCSDQDRYGRAGQPTGCQGADEPGRLPGPRSHRRGAATPIPPPLRHRNVAALSRSTNWSE